MPRRLFQKGDKRLENAGRKAGTPNRQTRLVREMLEDAAERIGGLERLVTWILKKPDNERIFWSMMYPRLMPLQVHGAGPRGELEFNINTRQLSRDQLETELKERGLPLSVFGIDKPDELPELINKTNGETDGS
jgi:hypothetical protein